MRHLELEPANDPLEQFSSTRLSWPSGYYDFEALLDHHSHLAQHAAYCDDQEYIAQPPAKRAHWPKKEYPPATFSTRQPAHLTTAEQDQDRPKQHVLILTCSPPEQQNPHHRHRPSSAVPFDRDRSTARPADTASKC